MRDPEKAPASAAVLAPAPSGRARFFAALLGLLLFCGGGWCLSAFVKSPSGQLPWLPGTWKGAPLILGACFGGVYGALLLILRRFSLRGMLLCSILSAALAAGLTAYVQTITETQTIRASLPVGSKAQDELLGKLREKITKERVLHFLEALREAGKLEGVQDFQAMNLSFAPGKSGDDIECRVEFEFLTYLQPATSPSRAVAARYVRALIAFYAIWKERPEDNNLDGLMKWAWVLKADRNGYLLPELGRLIVLDSTKSSKFPEESEFLIPRTMDEAFDPFLRKFKAEDYTDNDRLAMHLSQRAQWILETEQDEEIRLCLTLLREMGIGTYLSQAHRK